MTDDDLTPDERTLEDVSLPDEVEGFSKRRVELVQKAVKDWTHQLVDLGGRNNLIRFRDLKQGTLDLTERRLNVAVTRAKNRLTLVSSFTACDMDPERSNAEGVVLLRQYLQYVESGTNLGDRIIEKPTLNPFEVDVRDTLQRRGLKLVAQYGSSGYWIDYAVGHPVQPGRHVLAIECDGATYHSSESARDRDRLRQEHLERLGWQFCRIWSSEWFYDKERSVEKVLKAYEEAVARADADDRGETVKPPQRDTVTAEAPLTAAPPKRVGNKPVLAGYMIDDYTDEELAAVIRWIESDDMPRTKDELLVAAMAELDFQRRGTKIVSLTSAISRARSTQ